MQHMRRWKRQQRMSAGARAACALSEAESPGLALPSGAAGARAANIAHAELVSVAYEE